ncbi:MAG TPA: hypothetical protein VG940_07720 [Gemmatimonadales bacterium]|nr:hypothetical protein [Gemmatimonadales bacterium]
MSMLILRLLHVLTGIFWVGTMTFVTLFLIPSLKEDGALMGRVFGGLVKRNYMVVMPLVAILTILSGLAMIWVTSGGHLDMYMQTPSGHTFTMAGGLGIVGFLIGMFVARPAGMKAAGLGQQMAAATDPAAKAALQAEIAALQKRNGFATTLVTVLVLAAAAGMAIARYV